MPFTIDRKFALALSKLEGADVFELFALSNTARINFRGNKVDLCSIVNARSGACPEDCSFCAQSSHSQANISIYPLMSNEKIIEAAFSAKERGVKRFCIVTSGRKASERDLKQIYTFISEIKI